MWQPLFDLTISEDVFKTNSTDAMACCHSVWAAVYAPSPFLSLDYHDFLLTANTHICHLFCLLLLGSTENAQEYKKTKHVKAMKESCGKQRTDPDAGLGTQDEIPNQTLLLGYRQI